MAPEWQAGRKTFRFALRIFGNFFWCLCIASVGHRKLFCATHWGGSSKSRPRDSVVRFIILLLLNHGYTMYIRPTWNQKEKLIPRAQVVSQYLMSQGFRCSFTTETVKVVGEQTVTVDSLKPFPSHFCYKWGIVVLGVLSLSLSIIIINSICLDCVLFMAFSIDT